MTYCPLKNTPGPWLFSLGLVLALTACTPAPPPPERPNVVLIISDDQGWGDFGFMGHPVIQTPHLDRLASESAVFTNGYVPSSLCRPSLASMITGLYGHQHKICNNDPPPGVDRDVMLRFMAEAPSLPRLLQPLGYRSLQTGKWWEGHYANGGFTHGMTVNRENGRHGDRGLDIGRTSMQPIYDFIDEHGDEPFFIWYAPFLPHTPHNPPDRLLQKYLADGRNERQATYWAMVEWFDETVGALLDYLDQKGLRDHTLVLFTIDNGWIQNPDPPDDTWRFHFAPRSKRSPYDGGIRTPLLLRWPGHTRAGFYDDLVSTIDLAPTILAAAGGTPTPEMSGTSLLEVAAGRSPLDRDAVFGEIFAHDGVDLDRPVTSLQYRWIREKDWKLILPVDGPAELYNIAEDPYENRNRIADQGALAHRLTERLNAWWHVP